MNDIDFLPMPYRRKNAYLQAKPWQIIVVSAFLALLAIVTISQHIHRRLVENELEGLTPAYDMAVSQKQRLADVRSQINSLEAEADLVVYLHNPWPRSQLLSALMSRLPEEIMLQQLHISRDAENAPSPASRVTPPVSEASADKQKKVRPAKSDLQSLQNQFAGRQTLVLLTGTTTDSAALHRFLDDIQSGSLFSKAELVSANSQSENDGNTIHFNAKIFVKTGYGQDDARKDDAIIKKPG
jgi:hypothetical protein